MIMNSSGGNDFQAKKESDNSKLNSKSSAPSSSSRQWGSAAFKNPRIVRVSRTFGGKDRHSKVFTIRGLRDRRIRLSVPTAIQLYDLQEKLGVSQPSKVVDWLLDVTKDDIDKLPPLHIPPGFFNRFQQPPGFVAQELGGDVQLQPRPHSFFNANPTFMKGEDQLGVALNLREKSKVIDGKNKSIVGSSEQEDMYIPQVSGQSFFPLTQFGHHTFENSQNTHFPLYFNTPIATSIFPPPYLNNNNIMFESDPRAAQQQLNHFNLLSSSSQHPQLVPTLNLINSPMKPFISLNDNPRWPNSTEDDDSQPH